MKNLSNLYNSTVINVKGVNIGIIGYLTPDTKFLAPRNKVEYEDEIIALKREVTLLKDQGINIIIALGHSGFIKDLEIAKEVEDLDLVIGGHSNTFLLNTKNEEIPEIPQGHYPTWVTQPSGRRVPVVQAYAYTKYLGKLHLIFNSNGEIIESDGTPILLNQEVPRDTELLELVNKYRSSVDVVNNEVIGRSMILLNGDCRLRECNFGNMITDAVLYYTKKNYQDNVPDANIAIIQGGRIRNSIDKPEKPSYEVTHGDLLAVLPFTDTLCVVTINGTVLMQALEHSVAGWRTIDSPGQFIQVSGIKVIYDLKKPPGSRVVKSQAKCSSCMDSTLADIKPHYIYKLIMPYFLADGGDGYSMFIGLQNESLPYDELTALLAYFDAYSPVSPTVSDRVIILNEDKVDDFSDIIEINTLKESRSFMSNAVTINCSFTNFIVCFLIALKSTIIL